MLNDNAFFPSKPLVLLPEKILAYVKVHLQLAQIQTTVRIWQQKLQEDQSAAELIKTNENQFFAKRFTLQLSASLEKKRSRRPLMLNA